MLTLKPKPKRVLERKPIKARQEIPKISLDLAKNKVAVESTIKRLCKESPKDSPKIVQDYKFALDIVKKSKLDIDSARQILKTEKVSEETINSLLKPIEFRRKHFLETFQEFVAHSVAAQKNEQIREWDFINFEKVLIDGKIYKDKRAELISTIAKMAMNLK